MKISKLIGYQVLDSRGRPTVAASISLSDGTSHTARVPSGASTGKHEAKELRDLGGQYDEKFYAGLSVKQAVENINQVIAPRLVEELVDLAAIDNLLIELDSSPDHAKLGANATLAVSLATSIAAAHSQNRSLARYFQPESYLNIPMPMVNILSGGAHANKVMDIQDLLIVPTGATSFTQALSWIVAIRETASNLGKQAGFVTNLIADEGGLAISFDSVSKACEFVISAIEKCGLKAGEQVSLALDVASTQFFEDGKYNLKNAKQIFSSDQFVTYINNLVSNYPIVSIEDPFAEDDWPTWQKFMQVAPKKLQVIGDDLLTTNLARLNRAIEEKSANSILIKANQNGLVSSTLNVLKQARANNFNTVVSARSGENEDSWLADLATGWSAGQIKVGSTHGSERNSKWNRLLELEVIENTKFINPFN
ncbi:MAG: phosphopyruvate hydratase [Candidatus Nanopelagicus sp.]